MGNETVSAVKHVRCSKCHGSGDVCTGVIDGIPELFDCPVCLGTGNLAVFVDNETRNLKDNAPSASGVEDNED